MARTEKYYSVMVTALTAITAISDADVFAIVQAGVLKKASGSDIKALVAEPTLIVDADISTAPTSITLASAFSSLVVGGKIRYSWSGGDGTHTFSWSDGASYTFSGITADKYIGQGTGHLDIVKTATTTGNIVNAGEIWDSDGGNISDSGNFIDQTFKKFLNGECQYNCEVERASVAMTTNSASYAWTNSPSITETFPLSTLFALLNESGVCVTTQDACFSIRVSSVTTTGFTYNACRFASGTATVAMNGTFLGRWTTAYPRIT